ncbi:MAG: hypothetical protein Q8P59_13285, partial [Dehalococcoidia bacterium]|nr:hypothetical protein [Dehalococcoidia bacterium]
YLDSLCEERIYAGRGFDHNCEHTYKVIRDGIKYCTQHDPVRVAAKREALFKAYEEKGAAERKARAKDYHRLATWEGLLRTAKACLSLLLTLEQGEGNTADLLRQIIAMAEKED